MAKVTIRISGAQGAGKTLLAEFIKRQLGSHNIDSTLEKGGNPRGPDHDTLTVEMDADTRARIVHY